MPFLAPHSGRWYLTSHRTELATSIRMEHRMAKVFSPLISKSKYLEGLQCHKLIWFRYNAKDKIPPIDASTQAIFDQGHLVGNYAKKLFRGGVEIEAKPWEFAAIEKQSMDALTKRVPLFEAGFSHNGAFARFDILNPIGNMEWDLVEVKSSTEVKEVNIDDLSVQYYIAAGCGLKIRSCLLYYINNQYIRRGEIDPNKLFSSSDVTPDVRARLKEVPTNLAAMQEAIRLKTFPDIPIGPHCSDPYDCILMDLCWNFLPEHNVFTLYRSRRSFDWFTAGILELKDVPADTEFTETQQIQIETLRSGRPHVDSGAIAKFLETLRYPISLLDFETFNTAIPAYDNLRPYQRVPFQFSLHIQEERGEQPQHHSYLADGVSDPRPDVLSKLKQLLGSSGSIVCYNAAFEKGVLKECSEAFPEFGEWYETIEERIVDLIVPFRSFAYYHPDQKGSASLKVVLPVLTGKSYEGMPIADGDTASREYLRVTFGKVEPSDRDSVRRQLEAYCGYDTMAMIWILERLYRLTS